MFKDRKLLVTGGTGSIGSSLYVIILIIMVVKKFIQQLQI